MNDSFSLGANCIRPCGTGNRW